MDRWTDRQRHAKTDTHRKITKVNKLKGPHEDASVPLCKKKAITSGEGERDLGGNVEGRWGSENGT